MFAAAMWRFGAMKMQEYAPIAELNGKDLTKTVLA